MWARNDNGTCAEFIRHDPAGRYHPDIEWVQVPAELEPWVDHAYVVEAGTVAPPTLDHLATQILARVADRRWREQTKGKLIDGRRWHTDSEGRSSITDSLALATEYEAATGETWATKWKTMDGFVQVDRAALVAAGLQIGSHVTACFAREEAITDLVTLALADDTTTPTDLVAIHNSEIDTGWPA